MARTRLKRRALADTTNTSASLRQNGDIGKHSAQKSLSSTRSTINRLSSIMAAAKSAEGSPAPKAPPLTKQNLSKIRTIAEKPSPLGVKLTGISKRAETPRKVTCETHSIVQLAKDATGTPYRPAGITLEEMIEGLANLNMNLVEPELHKLQWGTESDSDVDMRTDGYPREMRVDMTATEAGSDIAMRTSPTSFQEGDDTDFDAEGIDSDSDDEPFFTPDMDRVSPDSMSQSDDEVSESASSCWSRPGSESPQSFLADEPPSSPPLLRL